MIQYLKNEEAKITSNKIYPSDLTNEQWGIIEPLILEAKPNGRPRTVDIRNVVDAILYICRTGSQWRYLPEKYPPRSTVYEYFSHWQIDGVWDQINKVLREQVRIQADRSVAQHLLQVLQIAKRSSLPKKVRQSPDTTEEKNQRA